MGFSYFEPPSIYDSLLVHDNTRIAPSIATISTFPKQRLNQTEYLQSFESSIQFLNSGRDLFAMVSDDEAVYLRSPTSLIQVFTRREFQIDNICYLHPVYSLSPEFQMVQSPPLGFSHIRTRRELRMHSVYGPITRGIMELIGYSTVVDPRRHEFTISSTFGTDQHDPVSVLV